MEAAAVPAHAFVVLLDRLPTVRNLNRSLGRKGLERLLPVPPGYAAFILLVKCDLPRAIQAGGLPRNGAHRRKSGQGGNCQCCPMNEKEIRTAGQIISPEGS